MTTITEFHFEELKCMQVVSTHGFGRAPEGIAIHNLRKWIEDHGLSGEVDKQRFFGFNNPDPSPGSPNYGYEQWMTLPEAYVVQAGDTIKTLAGGLYAVMGFINSTPESFGAVWQALASWRIDNGYQYDGSRQWLEECRTPQHMLNGAENNLSFDCYMPIKNK